MDTKDFRSRRVRYPHDRASRFMDRFMARKGELVGHPLPVPAGTDAREPDAAPDGSFVQLYLKALAAARQ